MKTKKLVKIFSIFFFLIFLIIIYLNISNRNSKEAPITKKIEDNSYSLNIIENVSYTSKDVKGNEYIIEASKGEIDLENSNIIFLTQVNAIIKLVDGDLVLINSDFGKYNINNFDTIFSKNVIINYLKNKITGEYLDFSMIRNSMIISKNVTYNNHKNILKADVIEVDIETKDTKIFMYENTKKVNIKNQDGSN